MRARVHAGVYVKVFKLKHRIKHRRSDVALKHKYFVLNANDDSLVFSVK